MSNLARKMQQEEVQQHKTAVKVKKIKIKNLWLSPGEKIMGVVFGAIVCFGAVHIISNQAAIYEMNKDIQDIQASIQDKEKSNRELEMQISELSTYERIFEKAKSLGLTLNENVRGVQDK
ncbi:cell division protein FtsL [Bacillus infantis]|uniref:cell division protein FtsL n=1 Tax=Bacillus infantis TaxID=324767 RepID=UPI001CD1BC7B|nr:cell division protein FtsL [Bacillus infantis]MCA1041090.1 cell division protein FtsL [Bacillus infantis]